MMSFFAPSFCAPAPAPAPELSFTPLFRLLEDFDNYSREIQAAQPAPTSRRQRTRQSRSQPLTFKPKFDVRETESAYELHGELPGLERENVNIEFPEPQTMVIRGRVERAYDSDANNNNNNNNNTTASSSTETTPEATGTEKQRRSSYRATVEDDPEDGNTPASTPSSSPKLDVAAPTPKTQTQEVIQTPAQNEPRYRLYERSVGEFSRVFSFPTRVDHDGVTASLSNGILSVTVPKAAKHVAKRIEISA